MSGELRAVRGEGRGEQRESGEEGEKTMQNPYRCFRLAPHLSEVVNLCRVGTAHHNLLRIGGRCPPYMLWSSCHKTESFTAPHPSPLTSHPSRAGFSLLEVLVSIFVLLFGLLAVAAMIPLAGLRIIQTNQADYSTACGQAGLRDVRVRRMLEPRNWLFYPPGAPAVMRNTNGYVPCALPEDVAALDRNLGIYFAASYAIDPLGFARNVTNIPAMAEFPYDLGGPAAIRMSRVSLDINPALNDPTNASGTNNTYRDMPVELADRIFTWRDDLQIPIPGDPGKRPEQVMLPPPPGAPLMAQIQGNYSWLVTVTPQAEQSEMNAGGGGPPFNRHYIDSHRTYRVSVVVFFNRDFAPPPPSPLANLEMPGERSVRAEMVGGGYSGGDVRLFLPSTSTDPPAFLDVKDGQWLMLCGRTTVGPVRNVFRWYRVVSAGEDPQLATGTPYASTATWQRYVTLAGPDWSTAVPGSWCPDYDGNSIPGEDLDGDSKDDQEVDAALFTRVIAVYTTTIELDQAGSVWAQ